MEVFKPKKGSIFLLFYFLMQYVCSAQAPIDLLKNEKYESIQYNSKLLNSNIKFRNNTLINNLLSENKISEVAYGNINRNTIFKHFHRFFINLGHISNLKLNGTR